MTSENDENYWSLILPDSPSKSIRNRFRREKDKGERYGDTRQTTADNYLDDADGHSEEPGVCFVP